MRKTKIFIFLMLVYPIMLCSKNSNYYWNEIIEKNLPKELKNIKIVERKDITDPDNLFAFDNYNPDIVIKDDFNNNKKEDIVIPCISKNDKNKWYIIIFEKNNNEYTYITFFEFNFKSLYIMKDIGKDNKKLIRVGQSFASDVATYIYWKNGKYVSN